MKSADRSGLAGATTFVVVSPEMTMLLGHGPIHGAPLPPDPMLLVFQWGASDEAARMQICASLVESGEADRSIANRLMLVIERAAYARIGGDVPGGPSPREYHLPSPLRAIAVALKDCDLAGEGLQVYRLAKSIELLCEAIRWDGERRLVPLRGGGSLSSEDTRRILAARRIIDEQWSERLTLQRIARACGLNRAKLTSRFREVFHCSVAEAIASKRLEEASKMLRTTDLPVACIGYRNGYGNNAAFSRAFSRRYGMPPSGFRNVGSLA